MIFTLATPLKFHSLGSGSSKSWIITTALGDRLPPLVKLVLLLAPRAHMLAARIPSQLGRASKPQDQDVSEESGV